MQLGAPPSISVFCQPFFSPLNALAIFSIFSPTLKKNTKLPYLSLSLSPHTVLLLQCYINTTYPPSILCLDISSISVINLSFSLSPEKKFINPFSSISSPPIQVRIQFIRIFIIKIIFLFSFSNSFSGFIATYKGVCVEIYILISDIKRGYIWIYICRSSIYVSTIVLFSCSLK